MAVSTGGLVLIDGVEMVLGASISISRWEKQIPRSLLRRCMN